jgi:DNA polymerase-3 subunit delta'
VNWAAVVGQPLAVRLLRRAVETGKVAHAYLFAGPTGVGKRTVARLLAQALLCRAPLPGGEPCGRCSACVRLTAEPPTHPDIHLVEPDGRFIKTDQMRELQGALWSRPSEGGRVVALIDGADKLNPEAGNRLLKLLEEPPSYAVLILLAENLAGVLPTILSRCQIVNFAPLTTDEMVGPLSRLTGLPADRARLIAALSGGSLGRAVAMAEDPAVAERRDLTYRLLQRLPDMDDVELLSESEALEKQKEGLEPLLEMLTVWLRDALLLEQMGSTALVLNADRQADLERLTRQYGPEQLLRMLAAVTDLRVQQRRNVNARLALDLLLLRLVAAAKGEPELALTVSTP